MHALMVQLFGQARYIVQGGDWGANIASWMAYKQPGALLGFHINMVNVLAEDAAPATPEEKDWFSKRAVILDWETGYNHEQETRPQTLGVAMADSPVGVAGWILEKFGKWADLPSDRRRQPGHLEQVFRGAAAHQYHALCRAIVGCDRDLDLSRQASGGIAEVSCRHAHPGAGRRRGLPRSRVSATAALVCREDLQHCSLERDVVGWPFRCLGTARPDARRPARVRLHRNGRWLA